jgi:2-keto-4-pentenoate hydratase/2-oxohepta-3-ene-1,7-dioic acid hydratase in catechol pathway
MKLATFVYQGSRRVGIVSDDGLRVQSLDLSTQENERGILALVDRKASGKPFPAVSSESIALSDVKLEAPIPRPMRNIFCVGRNYHAHAKELSTTVFKDNNADPNAWPIVFTKVPECVTGPYGDVHLPLNVSQQIDYEAELLVVIGVQGKNISKADAMSHVYGYTVVNDVTARDVQMRHQQWDLGKSFDTFCPMGPWVVTADVFDGLNAHVK